MLAPNESIVMVYTFAGDRKVIKIQLIGKQDETIISAAASVEETMRSATGQETLLVLKNDKGEVVGQFSRSQVAGWWIG